LFPNVLGQPIDSIFQGPRSPRVMAETGVRAVILGMVWAVIGSQGK